LTAASNTKQVIRIDHITKEKIIHKLNIVTNHREHKAQTSISKSDKSLPAK